jgi:hypothetical protein
MQFLIFLLKLIYLTFSDDSDAPTGIVRHLPLRLLGSQVEMRKRRKAATGNRLEASSDSDDDQEREDSRNWNSTNPGLLGTKIPMFVKPVMPVEDASSLENISSAYDFCKLYQTDRWVGEIVYLLKLYAVQNNISQALEIMNKDIYRCAEALLCTVATILCHNGGCCGKTRQTVTSAWWQMPSAGRRWTSCCPVFTSVTIPGSYQMVTTSTNCGRSLRT